MKHPTSDTRNAILKRFDVSQFRNVMLACMIIGVHGKKTWQEPSRC
ncbi:hypothetical protein GF325_10835 [Candidatus Bathyarchaeota archaeon]|nr:hypothetical protein [Candidatus Bathyarchaeota archaeon]